MTTANSTIPPAGPAYDACVTMTDIGDLGEHLATFVKSIKRNILAPGETKVAPVFNLSQLANLCSKSPDQMSRLLAKEPPLHVCGLHQAPPKAKARVFSLAEARAWVARVGPKRGRRPDQPGAIIAVANFKGGVGKTIAAMNLAQGLALKGYKILCIDYDPQGSMTSLFGISPGDIDESQTVLPLMMDRSSPQSRVTLQESIVETYFDGIDLIPGNDSLFSGEFFLPSRQMSSLGAASKEKGFKFYQVLDDALNLGIRQEYDYVVIDTPPSLSYMVMTCIWAADALLMPLPAEGLDFQSSSQFWKMLSELSTAIPSQKEKSFAWVGVVPSKIDHTNLQTTSILRWMKLAYQERLLSTEIPETAAVRVGGMRMETVYDMSKYIGSRKTLARAREAYDKLVNEVDFLTRRNFWNSTDTGGAL